MKKSRTEITSVRDEYHDNIRGTTRNWPLWALSFRIPTYALPFYDCSFRRFILFHSEAPSKVHSSESSVLPFHHRQLSVTSDLRPVPGTNAAVRSGIQSYPFQGGLEGYSDYLPFLNGLMYLIVGDDCSTLAW